MTTTTTTTTSNDNDTAPLPLQVQRKRPFLKSPERWWSPATTRATSTLSSSSTSKAAAAAPAVPVARRRARARACCFRFRFQLLHLVQCSAWCWLLLFSSVASSLSTLSPPNNPRGPRTTSTTRTSSTSRTESPVYTLPASTHAATVPAPVPKEYGVMPEVSPVTGLTNHRYDWKEGQSLRYCVAGPVSGQPVILVHGLFCNADHWRKTLRDLSGEQQEQGQGRGRGCRVYALDLLGCGYSDKPVSGSAVAKAVNGEAARFDRGNDQNIIMPDVARQVALGTADGKGQRIRDVPLRHPDGSPYNMYTWSDCVTDFCRDICVTTADNYKNKNENSENEITSAKSPTKVLLVGNSKGTVVALQAAMDHPELFAGVFCITPTFRELHAAEIPAWTMPIVSSVMRFLRTTKAGPAMFQAAAVPKIVKELLTEPYAVQNHQQVDDELVKALLDPLLTDGACPVLLDTLSYSAGPVPEQQLSDPNFPADVPVWIGYGEADPWTSAKRVQALQNRDKFPSVENVRGWPGVGHCPHDEAADAVHGMLMEFLQRLASTEQVPVVLEQQQQQQQQQQQPVQEQVWNRRPAPTGTAPTNASKRPFRPRARPRRTRTRTPGLVHASMMRSSGVTSSPLTVYHRSRKGNPLSSGV